MSGWLDVLRNACGASSQSKVAERIGYSAAVVNQVLKGTYKGDLNAVRKAVEGALMGASVDCPVIGQLPLQKCVEHQRAPFRISNQIAVQLHRTCPTCINSLKSGGAGKETP